MFYHNGSKNNKLGFYISLSYHNLAVSSDACVVTGMYLMHVWIQEFT